MTSFERIMMYMPDDIRRLMKKIGLDSLSELSEVRLYCGRGIVFIFPQSHSFLSSDGRLVSSCTDSGFIVNSGHMKHIIGSLSHFSIHSHEKELSEGCFVLESGIRVGLSGMFSHGNNSSIRDISSVNFRISREVIGCAEKLFERTFGQSLLICGSVNSGKTTLLRDIARLYGNVMKCTVIDERNEISAQKNGVPMNNVGIMTDIISGKSRHEAIISAIRTLSPEYIICDEIASEADAEAIKGGIGCGVKFIATVHASCISELFQRQAAYGLIKNNTFETAVFLKERKITEIRSLKNAL